MFSCSLSPLIIMQQGSSTRRVSNKGINRIKHCCTHFEETIGDVKIALAAVIQQDIVEKCVPEKSVRSCDHITLELEHKSHY